MTLDDRDPMTVAGRPCSDACEDAAFSPARCQRRSASCRDHLLPLTGSDAAAQFAREIRRCRVAALSAKDNGARDLDLYLGCWWDTTGACAA